MCGEYDIGECLPEKLLHNPQSSLLALSVVKVHILH